MAAEELAVPLDTVDIVTGDTALTPDQGATGGSQGVKTGGMQIRRAAATARQELLRLGAEQLKTTGGEGAGGRGANPTRAQPPPADNPRAAVCGAAAVAPRRPAPP